MTAEVRRSIVLAVAGLLGGFAMVVALFGTGELLKRNAAVNPSAETPATPGEPSAGAETGDRAGKTSSDAPATDSSHAALGALSQGGVGQGGVGQEASPAGQAKVREEDGAPSFDIVRVEPDGASVIAGRAAPNSRIALLRDGKPFATAQADAAGQFALTPPDLPPGTSEIALQATGPDGKPLPGRESVTIVVSDKRDAKPLIALSAPDAPTRVLSQPDAPEAGGKEAGESRSAANDPVREADKPAGKAPAPGAVRIVSVDAQEGGRLHVTGQTTAWSSLRLYLNDTMVASGRSGADGRVAFTIGRGVKPGAYRIRIDSVDQAGSKVKARAEVAFAYPDSGPPTRSAEAGTDDPAKPGVAATKRPATQPIPSRERAAESRAVAPQQPEADRSAPPARTAGIGAAPSLAAPPPAAAGTPTPAASSRAAAPVPSPPAGAAPPADAGAVFVPEVNTARITRGDSLWQISRRTYGRGNRYTVIYDANQDQIRDPNRIYPGQMFVLPKDAPARETPSARSGIDRRS
ncbi:LysM peptidoglycan-binding domain-containing protein [Methylorubrum populi]|jgi:nucleoid-associated protein YgaU|uniref:LysM peptidoglycan-binding domain-containing protein n=1 Tax=Methylorubrum rhodesianum TaxID=29427 RepID=A0ABU9ZKI7_9HYPH|nr:LysM peptidoglycan-binding domain-containing protein [Methylorubrum rhodesianum]MBK3402498.1 LysM peptidoglycan-binding domain-containing protein [Methylorubrum rhodesianum]MBY0141578.1 LysM peptidoglycan-binding domain-containing protein [Methylorubrum populi]